MSGVEMEPSEVGDFADLGRLEICGEIACKWEITIVPRYTSQEPKTRLYDPLCCPCRQVDIAKDLISPS